MKWKKLGKIFDPTKMDDGFKRDWMHEYAQCTSTIVYDDFVRIYFSTRPKQGLDGQSISFTTFLDVKRDDLSKIINIAKEPILPLGELGAFDEFAIYPTSVIRYGDKIRLYYAGWYRCQSVPFNTSIGLASSNDGVKFKREGRGPILSFSLDEPFVISGPKIRRFSDLWYLYYLSGREWINNEGKPEIVYKIRMATSIDGKSWVKENNNIISDLLDEKECQAGPDVFYYKNKYHMYFVYRHALDFRNNKCRGYKIGYAYSDDLYNWIRNDQDVGINYSKTGWDSSMHHYPHVFELDNKYYMLYNGNEFGKYGFGLAVLEND